MTDNPTPRPLVELEAKWREYAKVLEDDYEADAAGPHDRAHASTLTLCADELAAALAAEQPRTVEREAHPLWVRLYDAVCGAAHTSPPFHDTLDDTPPETREVSDAMNAIHAFYGGHPWATDPNAMGSAAPERKAQEATDQILAALRTPAPSGELEVREWWEMPGMLLKGETLEQNLRRSREAQGERTTTRNEEGG